MNFRRLSTLVAVVLVTLGSRPLAAQEIVDAGWTVELIERGSRPGFAFGPGDDFHVLAIESSELGVTSWYARAEQARGPWSKKILSQGDFYMPGEIIVASDGTVHAVYHNHKTEDAEHVIVTPSGDVAAIHRVETPDKHDGWDSSLAFDGAGRLHMAAVDPITVGGVRSLQYGVFDGGAWAFGPTSLDDRFISGLGVSLALDAGGAPHIAYCVSDGWYESGALKLAVKDSEAWTAPIIVEGEGRGRFPSLALDGEGRPHVAWLDVDPADETRGEVRYAVRSGGEWLIETVGELTHIKLGFADARRSVSLALDGAQAPHIAFGDKQAVRYATRGAEGWRVTTVAMVPAATYNGHVVLRLDSTGLPAIAFWQNIPDGGDFVCIAAKKSDSVKLFNRGDPDSSGSVDISDAISIFGFLFLGGAPPECSEAADANNDGGVDISDGVAILGFLFLGEPPPTDPGPPATGCGPDPDPPGSPGDLGCDFYNGCAV